ncbi:hypothetical protein DsansV1_C05g0056081 [Dioscorea sansibarensis]
MRRLNLDLLHPPPWLKTHPSSFLHFEASKFDFRWRDVDKRQEADGGIAPLRSFSSLSL